MFKTNQETRKFSEWIHWILDSFGDDARVLEAIGSNVGSFSWSGDIRPLYRQQIEAFSEYENSKNPTVADWAMRNIRHLKECIKRENDNEEYMSARMM